MSDGQQTPQRTHPGLWVLALFLGIALGYGVAFIERLLLLPLLGAGLIGVLGGGCLLFAGVVFRARGVVFVVLSCSLLGLGGFAGEQIGGWRFARRAASWAGDDPALGTLTPAEGEAVLGDQAIRVKRREAARGYEQSLRNETGHDGPVGYFLQRVQSGALWVRFGPFETHLPAEPIAVLLAQLLNVGVSIFLAWLVIRRLEWVAGALPAGRDLERCAVCGLKLGPAEIAMGAAEGLEVAAGASESADEEHGELTGLLCETCAAEAAV